jgi:soluble lytic murein transglycosylase
MEMCYRPTVIEVKLMGLGLPDLRFLMEKRRRRFSVALAYACFLAIFAAFPITLFAATGISQDKALLAAREAFLAGDKVKFARHAEKIRGHELDAYISFWKLRLGLEEATPEELREFLFRNAGSVLAEQLRRDWLRVLGRTRQWELFREEESSLAKSDPDVACYSLQARWILSDPSVSSEVKSFLMTPRAMPEGCIQLTDMLLQSGELKPRNMIDRFRLLIQANLMTEAKRAAGRLPAMQAPAAGQIEDASRAPAKFLEQTGNALKTAVGRELAIIALTRLVQSDLQSAVRLWSSGIKDDFPPEDQQYVWAMLATHGSYHGLPEALDWFRQAGEAPLTEEQLAWRVRSALRQKNWVDVKYAIERMPPLARNDPAWLYWLGRALCALGEGGEGKILFGRIADEHHFYGQLAAAELDIPLKIPSRAAAPTRGELASVAALSGLQRALKLYRLGLRTEATAEWTWTIRTMDDRALLAAAELARSKGIWDRAINTAEKTVAVHDFSLRYMTPYQDLFSKQARLWKLEESLVFGLVRQESRFLTEAKSPVGASGLMQLLPSTARWVAGKIGMKGFSPSRVSHPEVNVALGAFYLRHMLDGFNGNPVLAAAAYNAGPGRARRWCDAKPLEGAIYIETIPFAETRQYVKKVMANTMYYAAVLGAEPRSLKSRLGTIESAVTMKETDGE